jgi:hypothetical protein
MSETEEISPCSFVQCQLVQSCQVNWIQKLSRSGKYSDDPLLADYICI